MKTLVFAALLLPSASVFAHGHDDFNHRYGRHQIEQVVVGRIVDRVLPPPGVQYQPVPVYGQPPLQRQPIYSMVYRYNVDCECFAGTWQIVGWR